MLQESEPKFAIRFGLGAIKAVGFGATETMTQERKANGNFGDIYDFAERVDPKNINKKSIEALAKVGAFDSLSKNRRQISESFDVLASYSAEKKDQATSNQMSLFSGFPEANAKPELRKVLDWNKAERLQKEFESFGFFLNEHPLDDYLLELKKRGVIFSDKIERDELEDNNLVKMAGVVAGSKHRSGPRGRFAYLTISDPLGMFEAMVFDEALITAARDILVDGSAIALECLVRKDEGGVRILVRDVKKLDDFVKTTKAQDKPFEDIKKQASRNYNRNNSNSDSSNRFNQSSQKPLAKTQSEVAPAPQIIKKAFSKIEIIIKDRDVIFAIKSLLSQCLTPIGCEKFTKVFFSVMNDGKIFKVELPKNYLLDEADVVRLRKIEKIIDVESSI